MDLLHLVKTPEQGAVAEKPPTIDVETGPMDPVTEKEDMKAFLATVAVIKSDITSIGSKQTEVLDLFEEGKAMVNAKQIRSNREAMTAKVQEIQTSVLKVKNQIQGLDRANEEWLQIPGNEVGNASERMRSNITSGLRKQLQETVLQFNAMREKIHDYHKETVKQRVYTVTGEHVNDDQAETILTGGNPDDIFKAAMQNMDRQKAQLVLDEINQKNADMKGLEQSLLELHQVFLDMAVLVEAQQGTVDDIEKNMQSARNYAETGVKHVTEAKNLYKSINKKKVICWTIIAIALILAALFVALMIWKFVGN